MKLSSEVLLHDKWVMNEVDKGMVIAPLVQWQTLNVKQHSIMLYMI